MSQSRLPAQLRDHSPDVMVIGLTTEAEHYVWIYHPDRVEELIRHFGEFAADPELSLTWYQAGDLAYRVRAYTN